MVSARLPIFPTIKSPPDFSGETVSTIVNALFLFPGTSAPPKTGTRAGAILKTQE